MNTRRIVALLVCVTALLALPAWTCAGPTGVCEVLTPEATAYNNARRIAVDAEGNIHIVFQKELGKAIRYGEFNGSSWDFHDFGPFFYYYYYPAIALNNSGYPFIAAVKFIDGTDQLVVLQKNHLGQWVEHCEYTAERTEHIYDPSIEIYPGDLDQNYWHVAWISYDDDSKEWQWMYKYRGQGAQSPYDPTDDGRGIHDLSIDIDPDGRVHVSFLFPIYELPEDPWTLHMYLEDEEWTPGGCPTFEPPGENACIDWDHHYRTYPFLLNAVYERHDEGSGVNTVEHNRWEGYDWGETPLVLSGNATAWNYPVIDDAEALWQDIDKYGGYGKMLIHHRSYRYADGSWSPTEVVSETKYDSRYPQIVYEYIPGEVRDAIHMIWTRQALTRFWVMYYWRYVVPRMPVICADVGKEAASTYCRHRDGYIDYGDLACFDVDYGDTNLVYFFEGLDSTDAYWLEVSSYQETDTQVVQLIVIDGDTVETCVVGPCQPEYTVCQVPQDAILDGEIEVRILKESGEFAAAGFLNIYAEEDEGGEGMAAPGPQVSAVTGGPSVESLGLTARPNPFRGSTTVELEIPRQCAAVVEVYDIGGRLVKSLTSGVLDAGVHRFVWNGENDSGSDVPSGVYICRGGFQGQVRATKVVLAR